MNQDVPTGCTSVGPKTRWTWGRKWEEEAFTLDVWKEVHPRLPPPAAISQPCCAQFAVSRDAIRSNPKSEYVRLRDWLLNTKLEDKYSGRVMEYSWQILFTGLAEVCPEMNACYCEGYGVCFGGKGELDGWIESREQIRAINAEADRKQAAGAAEPEVASMRTTVEKLLTQLIQHKKDAFKRGKDISNGETIRPS